MLLTLSVAAACAQDGAALYKARCARCHDAPNGRTPPFSALRDMNPTKVLHAIESGAMKPLAEGLSSAARHALVGYITYPPPKITPPPETAFCDAGSLRAADFSKGPQWVRWGADVHNTRFQSASAAGITAADLPKLKLKWAFGLGDTTAARAQPSVAGGAAVFGK